MSHQGRALHESNLAYETWILFRMQALRITRKTSLTNLELCWPLYVQCHIKMGFDMNPSFIVITAKTELVREVSTRITRKTLSAFQSQCIRCMTNVTSGQSMTWLQSHSWSLKHEYCSESKPWEPQEKLRSQFRAMVTAVCSMSQLKGTQENEP